MDEKTRLHLDGADSLPAHHHRQDRDGPRLQRQEEDGRGGHLPGQGVPDPGHREDV